MPSGQEGIMSEIIEQFLQAAMRLHYSQEQDTCQECRRTGKEIAARIAQGIQHHCLHSRRCQCQECQAFEKAIA